MDISYRWLQALVPGLDEAPERLAERLAMCGAPVDAVEYLGAGLGDVKIARVIEARRHPNADRLSLCQVDAGTGEILNVVCGAPNVRTGGVYPFIPAGGTLPGGLTIKRAKIRGEESNGMLCSARELGIGREHEGILELQGDFTPGESFTQAVGLDDWRFVLDITANRPDLLSHIGVAREIAADIGGTVKLPPVPASGDGRPDAGGLPAGAPSLQTTPASGEIAGVRISIEAPDLCPRYMAVVVRGLKIGPSPEWLAARVRAVGLRPISNVVDATNYVMYELGQPLHAFDLRYVHGPEIRVRRAQPGETITTLDGEKRDLTPDMLVIADAERAVALAGVMGGENSEVAPDTTDVLVECALFDPKSVRRTRRALGMSTDASYRMERGVDPEGMERAARRVLELIAATAGGRIEPVIADVSPRPYVAPDVAVRPERVGKVLGVPFQADQIVGLLEPLGFEATARDAALHFRVPGARSYDVTREIDLIEEIARRYGYDRFPDELGPQRVSAVPEHPVALLEDRLRTLLVGRGFLESRTMGLAPEAEGDVALSNPLSSAEGRLRRALLPALVHRVEHNFAHGIRDVRLFEIGTTFAPGEPGGVPREETRLAVAFTGARHAPHWSTAPEPTDVWDLKGLLVELATLLDPADAGVVEPDAADPWFVAGLSFRVPSDAGWAGHGGQIAPARLDAPAWAGPVWGLELPLSASPAALGAAAAASYAELPAFPSIDRDLALVIPDAVPAARAEALIRQAGGTSLQAVWPFDLYRGAGIPAGTRSIAYRLLFRAPDRTLTDREVEQAVDRVLRRLKDEIGVERR